MFNFERKSELGLDIDIENKYDKTFNAICEMLENREIKYDIVPHKEVKNVIVFRGNLKGFFLHTVVFIDAEKDIFKFECTLPIEVSPEYKHVIAETLCLINSQLMNGSFNWNLKDNISFQIAQYIFDSAIGMSDIETIFSIMIATVQGYTEKIFAVSKGYITPINAIQ